MNTIELLKKIGKYKIFTFNEFVRLTGRSCSYCRLYLHRLKKKKLIFSIERGKYTLFDDSIVFSSLITVPSYITSLTAFRIYNFTEQLPNNIMIAVPKSRKKINFYGTDISFFKIHDFWGYNKLNYRGSNIFIAEKEKSIIDALLIKRISFDEIFKAVKTKDYDVDLLKRYAIKTKNKSLIKRLGYLLEINGLNADELIYLIDNNYIPLDFNIKRRKGEKNKKWRLLINTKLYDNY
ncbi:hypothetical protein HYW75_04245 [Candidatus Pacearchaeota archaeon]|nr:hypothetical protein [Candidatus Pacearchaeota archaeon]